MTIIVSSHILSELEDYSTHMLVLRGGRLVEQRALGTTSDGRGAAVMLRLARHDDGSKRCCGPSPRVGQLMVEGLTAQFQLRRRSGERAMLLRRLIAAELPVADFAAERESLQDLYMSGVAPAARRQKTP